MILKRILIGLFLLPANLLLAEGPRADIVLVADSRKLHGLMAWWSNLFNQSHFYFALLTVVAIPVAGIILGSLADLAMGRIGINLKSRSLREG